MDIARAIQEVRRRVGSWRRDGRSVGVVPTMGALHQGHLSLVDRAMARCDRTVVTLFVNPIQFAANEDYDVYPRQEERDADLLSRRGCDLLFAPPVDEMFPDGYAVPAEFKTGVVVRELSDGLCGAVRPGHFHGVATQVMKLLMITAPDVAFFGEKDYQQLQVIRRMVRDLNVPVTIDGAPTVREPDGLALSSRNVYLTAAERRVAPLLYEALRRAAADLGRGTSAVTAAQRATLMLLEGGFRRVDYVTLTDADTLEPLADANRPARLLAAAWLGRARLVDNIAVEARQPRAE